MSQLPAPSDAVLERLLSLHPKRIDLVLDRIERLLAALGPSGKKLPPVFHVAGTNGKGSVCAYLRAMIEARGGRVHVYTSPHLVRFNERIRVAGSLITEDELAATLLECERANAGAPITFFEITTAAAFLAFSRHPADALVLEVGLGGRFDATNVIRARSSPASRRSRSTIRNFSATISRDIAWEKAGILKPGVPAIVGPQSEEGRDAIVSEADRIGAPVFAFGQDFSAHEEHGRLFIRTRTGLLDLPLPKLAGRHQIGNAAIAIAALRHCAGAGRWAPEAIERGPQTVEWPARLQRLPRASWSTRRPRAPNLARRRAQSAWRRRRWRRAWRISRNARPSRSISFAAC